MNNKMIRTLSYALLSAVLVILITSLEEAASLGCDALYVLEAAVEDVDRDLESAKTAKDYREALHWLLQAARPLVTKRLT